jgi:predicted  nucleic acid-binding Zn-ribbon protein
VERVVWNQPATNGQENNKVAETLNTRVTRLEEALVALTDAQIKTETRFQEVASEIKARDEKMDERIGTLVSAIGELIRRIPIPEQKN